MFFFGRLGGLPGQWQAFIANPASFFSKLVDRHPDGSSIEPSDSLAALNHLRIPPELPECFGCDFLRACRVANYPRNGPGDAFVMNVEERFEIESVVEAGSLNRLAWRLRLPASTTLSISKRSSTFITNASPGPLRG